MQNILIFQISTLYLWHLQSKFNTGFDSDILFSNNFILYDHVSSYLIFELNTNMGIQPCPAISVPWFYVKQPGTRSLR